MRKVNSQYGSVCATLWNVKAIWVYVVGRNSTAKDGAFNETCNVMRKDYLTGNVTLLQNPGSVLSVKYFELQSVHYEEIELYPG